MDVVAIELQRVQTFLFAVPQLRAMLGANALLGEVLRRELPKLAKELGAADLSKAWAARAVTAAPEDPIQGVCKGELADLADDPRAQLERGILHRDGGHFWAMFPAAGADAAGGESPAARFAREAAGLLSRRLPGLSYRITVRPLGQRPASTRRATERQLFDLPQAQICQASGRGPASRLRVQGKDRTWESEGVRARRLAGAQPARRKALDMVGLLERAAADWQKPLKWQTPRDLGELAGGGYLAVIHADGNGVGRLADTVAREEPESGMPASAELAPADAELAREIRIEAAYHRMRVRVRRALAKALEQTFGGAQTAGRRVKPYTLLMQGGDDLLLVCTAARALDFVVEYARALRDDAEPAHALTIGVGVVISRPQVPFHHLHALAESLAASAKALHRGLSEKDQATTSVVDWLVSTESSPRDPIQTRRADALVTVGGERLVLTGRPLPITSPPTSGEARAEADTRPRPRLDTLEGLLAAAKSLVAAPSAGVERGESGEAARSQLRALVPALAQGRVVSGLLFDELPRSTRDALRVAGLERGQLWTRAGDEAAKTWLTRLGDLVEVFEIRRLGRSPEPGAGQESTAELASSEGGR